MYWRSCKFLVACLMWRRNTAFVFPMDKKAVESDF